MILRNVEDLNWAMDGHIMDHGEVISDRHRGDVACNFRTYGASTSDSSHVRWHCRGHQSNNQNWTAKKNHSHSQQKGKSSHRTSKPSQCENILLNDPCYIRGVMTVNLLILGFLGFIQTLERTFEWVSAVVLGRFISLYLLMFIYLSNNHKNYSNK